MKKFLAIPFFSIVGGLKGDSDLVSLTMIITGLVMVCSAIAISFEKDVVIWYIPLCVAGLYFIQSVVGLLITIVREHM